MERRDFLKSSLVLAGGTMGAHWFNQSALASPANRTGLIRVTGAWDVIGVPMDISVWANDGLFFKNVELVPVNGFRTSPMNNPIGWKILQYLIGFAAAVGTDVVANGVYDWLKTLNTADKKVVQSTVNMMKSENFTDQSKDTVYNVNDVDFYGFGHEDELNACVGLHHEDKSNTKAKLKTMMMEGPAILGASLGAKYWTNTKVSKADGLVPQDQISYSPSSFEKSMREPVIATTKAGAVGFDYKANPKDQSGVINIVSVEDDGSGGLQALMNKRIKFNYIA
ncbi:hypothetical protein QUF64_14260 [Anaerolineales bacterium HSG6]|nr:hypothetical protein [Anaerolineales bacterium HSG6]